MPKIHLNKFESKEVWKNSIKFVTCEKQSVQNIIENLSFPLKCNKKLIGTHFVTAQVFTIFDFSRSLLHQNNEGWLFSQPSFF
jgi:hypothetical protein